MTLNARRLALLVAANTALAPFAIDAYLPAMAALAEDVGASIHHTELSLSAFLAGFALGQLIFGPVSDRVGRKPVLLGGLVVFLLASLVITTVGSLPELLAWRFVQALGGGATVVNSAAIVRDCFQGREAAKVMSTMAIIMLMAPLAAPVVGSALLYLGDWWLIFVFLAVYAGFLMWLLGTRLPETRAPGRFATTPRQVLGNYVSVLRDRRAMGFIAAASMTFAGLFAFVTASPFLYLEHFGLTPSLYPLVFGVNVVIMVAANRLNIRLLRWYTPLQNLRLGLGIQLVAGLGLALVVATGLESLATMVPLIMLFAGTIGLVAPNAITSLLDRFPHMSATAAALQGSIQFSCGALAGVLVGAFEIDSAWPMVGTMLGATLLANLGIRVLAGTAEPEPQAHG